MSALDASKVQELMHRLQSLDVDLQEAARARQITDADYTVRLKRLRRAINEARKLKEAASAQTMPTPLPSHFDLPVMSGYSRVEQKIVAKFVTDTKNYTDDLATKLKKVSDWSLEAVHDTLGWLKVIWRLSWIRREMRRLEQDIERVRKARGVVEDFISRSEIGGLEPNPKTNQRDLLAAFTEFEVATGKVTAMRAKLRTEMNRNEEMKNWLAKYANTRRQTNPEKVPPEPDEVSALGGILADHFVGGAKLANDRLVVARRLAYSLNHTDATDAVSTGPANTVSPSAADHQQNRAQKAHHYGRKKNRYPRRGAGL
jgi:chromosome segregation ATPase